MDYKVNILDITPAYKGYFKLNKYRVAYRQFNGHMGGEVQREVFERGHAVAVIPYDPIADKIILIEQFRIGTHIGMQDENWMDKNAHAWMYEIVAGVIDKGEQPSDVAIREMKEEANLDILDLRYIQPFFVSPGAVSEYIHLYLAIVDSRKAGGIFGLEDEAEDIKTHILPTAEVWQLLDSGKITNATALIALQWLRLNHKNIKPK